MELKQPHRQGLTKPCHPGEEFGKSALGSQDKMNAPRRRLRWMCALLRLAEKKGWQRFFEKGEMRKTLNKKLL